MLFAAATLLGTVVFGVAPITAPSSHIGDGFLDARRVGPYDNAFVVTIYKDGKSQTPGIWTDQLRLREIDGKTVAVRTQSLGYFDGRTLHSVNVFDPSTFAPISDTQIKPDGSREQWRFSSGKAEGTLHGADGNVEEKALDIIGNRFDLNCCMRSLVPAMIRLSEGMDFVIPSIEGPDGATDVRFKVLRREHVRAGGLGMVEAWVVETEIPGGFIHFWIHDRAPYLVRMTLSQNDRNAYSQSFDMIEPGPPRIPPEAPK